MSEILPISNSSEKRMFKFLLTPPLNDERKPVTIRALSLKMAKGMASHIYPGWEISEQGQEPDGNSSREEV